MPTPSFYGPTPAATVDAAFDGSRRPSAEAPLEAPAGQYDGCLEAVAERTGGGEPPVTEGAYEYRQAKALAGGGKVAALSLEPDTGLVRCSAPGGVTAAVRHAQTVWAAPGAEVEPDDGGLFGAARDAAGAVGGAAGWAVGKVFGKMRGKVVKRAVRGVVGRNPAGLIVAAGPSVYRALVTGEVSYAQATKNLFEAGTTAAGAAGGAAVGAAMGATVGSIVPVFGTFLGGAAGGLAGGLLGGGFGERGGRLIADNFAPDDADALRPLLKEELADLAFEHALVPEEVDRLRTAADAATTEKFLRDLFKTYSTAEADRGRAAAVDAVRKRARATFAGPLNDVLAGRAHVPAAA